MNFKPTILKIMLTIIIGYIAVVISSLSHSVSPTISEIILITLSGLITGSIVYAIWSLIQKN